MSEQLKRLILAISPKIKSNLNVELPEKTRKIVLDALDILFTPRDQLIPPLRLRHRLGNDFDYASAGLEWFKILKDMAELQPNEKILDVGCGLGRMAVPLTRYLNAEGSYYGFDVVKEFIDWCRGNISTEYHNFHFDLVNLKNPYYSRSGRAASKYVFSYPDGFFDVVFLASIFTHLLPDDMENYLSEIHRVLTKGGRSLITFFLLNNFSPNIFKKVTPIFSTLDLKVSEKGIAYDEKYVLSLYMKNRLSIKDIKYGSWSGASSGWYQDIILAIK